MSQPSKKSVQNSKDLEKLTITELMNQLDEIVAWFGGDDVNIDDAAVKFSEGVELTKVIKVKLADSQTKINEIKLDLSRVHEG